MHLRSLPLLLGVTTLLGLAIFPVPARAGGGPMNVIVLYSSDDASATEVSADRSVLGDGNLNGNENGSFERNSDLH